MSGAEQGELEGTICHLPSPHSGIISFQLRGESCQACFFIQDLFVDGQRAVGKVTEYLSIKQKVNFVVVPNPRPNPLIKWKAILVWAGKKPALVLGKVVQVDERHGIISFRSETRDESCLFVLLNLTLHHDRPSSDRGASLDQVIQTGQKVICVPEPYRLPRGFLKGPYTCYWRAAKVWKEGCLPSGLKVNGTLVTSLNSEKSKISKQDHCDWKVLTGQLGRVSDLSARKAIVTFRYEDHIAKALLILKNFDPPTDNLCEALEVGSFVLVDVEPYDNPNPPPGVDWFVSKCRIGSESSQSDEKSMIARRESSDRSVIKEQIGQVSEISEKKAIITFRLGDTFVKAFLMLGNFYPPANNLLDVLTKGGFVGIDVEPYESINAPEGVPWFVRRCWTRLRSSNINLRELDRDNNSLDLKSTGEAEKGFPRVHVGNYDMRTKVKSMNDMESDSNDEVSDRDLAEEMLDALGRIKDYINHPENFAKAKIPTIKQDVGPIAKPLDLEWGKEKPYDPLTWSCTIQDVARMRMNKEVSQQNVNKALLSGSLSGLSLQTKPSMDMQSTEGDIKQENLALKRNIVLLQNAFSSLLSKQALPSELIEKLIHFWLPYNPDLHLLFPGHAQEVSTSSEVGTSDSNSLNLSLIPDSQAAVREFLGSHGSLPKIPDLGIDNLPVLATVWNILTESQAVAKIESGGSFDSLVLVNRDISYKDGECLSRRDLRQVLSVVSLGGMYNFHIVKFVHGEILDSLDLKCVNPQDLLSVDASLDALAVFADYTLARCAVLRLDLFINGEKAMGKVTDYLDLKDIVNLVVVPNLRANTFNIKWRAVLVWMGEKPNLLRGRVIQVDDKHGIISFNGEHGEEFCLFSRAHLSILDDGHSGDMYEALPNLFNIGEQVIFVPEPHPLPRGFAKGPLTCYWRAAKVWKEGSLPNMVIPDRAVAREGSKYERSTIASQDEIQVEAGMLYGCLGRVSSLDARKAIVTFRHEGRLANAYLSLDSYDPPTNNLLDVLEGGRLVKFVAEPINPATEDGAGLPEGVDWLILRCWDCPRPDEASVRELDGMHGSTDELTHLVGINGRVTEVHPRKAVIAFTHGGDSAKAFLILRNFIPSVNSLFEVLEEGDLVSMDIEPWGGSHPPVGVDWYVLKCWIGHTERHKVIDLGDGRSMFTGRQAYGSEVLEALNGVVSELSTRKAIITFKLEDDTRKAFLVLGNFEPATSNLFHVLREGDSVRVDVEPWDGAHPPEGVDWFVVKCSLSTSYKKFSMRELDRSRSSVDEKLTEDVRKAMLKNGGRTNNTRTEIGSAESIRPGSKVDLMESDNERFNSNKHELMPSDSRVTLNAHSKGESSHGEGNVLRNQSRSLDPAEGKPKPEGAPQVTNIAVRLLTDLIQKGEQSLSLASNGSMPTGQIISQLITLKADDKRLGLLSLLLSQHIRTNSTEMDINQERLVLKHNMILLQNACILLLSQQPQSSDLVRELIQLWLPYNPDLHLLYQDKVGGCNGDLGSTGAGASGQNTSVPLECDTQAAVRAFLGVGGALPKGPDLGTDSLPVLATVWNILSESQVLAKVDIGINYGTYVAVGRDVSFKEGQCLVKQDLRQVLSVGQKLLVRHKPSPDGVGLAWHATVLERRMSAPELKEMEGIISHMPSAHSGIISFQLKKQPCQACFFIQDLYVNGVKASGPITKHVKLKEIVKFNAVPNMKPNSFNIKWRANLVWKGVRPTRLDAPTTPAVRGKVVSVDDKDGVILFQQADRDQYCIFQATHLIVNDRNVPEGKPLSQFVRVGDQVKLEQKPFPGGVAKGRYVCKWSAIKVTKEALPLDTFDSPPSAASGLSTFDDGTDDSWQSVDSKMGKKKLQVEEKKVVRQYPQELVESNVGVVRELSAKKAVITFQYRGNTARALLFQKNFDPPTHNLIDVLNPNDVVVFDAHLYDRPDGPDRVEWYVMKCWKKPGSKSSSPTPLRNSILNKTLDTSVSVITHLQSQQARVIEVYATDGVLELLLDNATSKRIWFLTRVVQVDQKPVDCSRPLGDYMKKGDIVTVDAKLCENAGHSRHCSWAATAVYKYSNYKSAVQAKKTTSQDHESTIDSFKDFDEGILGDLELDEDEIPDIGDLEMDDQELEVRGERVNGTGSVAERRDKDVEEPTIARIRSPALNVRVEMPLPKPQLENLKRVVLPLQNALILLLLQRNRQIELVAGDRLTELIRLWLMYNPDLYPMYQQVMMDSSGNSTTTSGLTPGARLSTFSTPSTVSDLSGVAYQSSLSGGLSGLLGASGSLPDSLLASAQVGSHPVSATILDIPRETHALAKIDSGLQSGTIVLIRRDICYKGQECISDQDLREVLSIGQKLSVKYAATKPGNPWQWEATHATLN
ncbi:unnamed protein product [Darwinula stevensoni]|uniref:Uncharacterized protein n=1 Tax=Darwinula stevensoni TaxID=69355 RepID=A0A7R8X5G5_9CRUS|nr:unnamed protein product [Darwinula stevensoni]CAG0880904.1 unnamed protein product [Darwinula stevensoni]